jgi:hypothetical protein
MGTDTHLYLSTEWQIDDIVNVLHNVTGAEVTVEPSTNQPNCYSIDLKGDKINRSIFCITPTRCPVGNCTWMSLRSNDEGIKIFRDVAEVLGGILQPADTTEDCEMVSGKVDVEDGLPYFLRYAIVHDNIEPDDLQGLIDSIKRWYDETDSCSKNELRRLAKQLTSKK